MQNYEDLLVQAEQWYAHITSVAVLARVLVVVRMLDDDSVPEPVLTGGRSRSA